MDDESAPGRRLSDGLERSDNIRCRRSARLRQAVPSKRENDEKHTERNERSRPRDGERHASMVALVRSQVGHAFVPNPCQSV
jgi:hypothetical protein